MAVSICRLTGRRISREGGKAAGFSARSRLDPRGCAALRAAQAADAIRRPVDYAVSAQLPDG